MDLNGTNMHRQKRSQFFVHWMNNKNLDFSVASDLLFLEVKEKLRKQMQRTERPSVDSLSADAELEGKPSNSYKIKGVLIYMNIFKIKVRIRLNIRVKVRIKLRGVWLCLV